MAKATPKYGDKPITGVTLELAKHEAQHIIDLLNQNRGRWHEPYFAVAIRDQLVKALRPVPKASFTAEAINTSADRLEDLLKARF